MTSPQSSSALADWAGGVGGGGGAVRRGSLAWEAASGAAAAGGRGASGSAGVSVGAVETPDVGRLEVGWCSSLLAAASCRPVITA